MRALDARAIAELGIPGPTLMENAGRGAADVIAREHAPMRGKRVLVLCGKGNNGGDGFVVARRLGARGARVDTVLLGRRDEVRGDARAALARLRGRVAEISDEAALDGLARPLARADLVVDALLGTGLTGPARGLVARAIELIDAAARPTVSLDLPSGLGADGGELLGPTVHAALTVTFAGYKRSLLLHPAAACAGRVVVVDLGVPPEEVARGIGAFLLEESDARAPFPSRPKDSHKGTYGHLLIVAGSLGKTGAAALAGHAALRGGLGLCTIAAPRSQQPIVAVMSREAMTEPLDETRAQSIALSAAPRILELAARTDAVALGPGLSLDDETQALVRALVREVPRPMVVDADALSALAGHLDVLDGAAGPRVLTPHPGEMARMLGTTIAAVQSDRMETARAFASRHRACVALKGVNTVIAGPDGRVLVNPTGNPGMATGGSGDALTGLTGAFLARRLDPLTALASACYLHGLAGDLAAAARGEEGLIAGDIADAVGLAMRRPAAARTR